MIKAYHAVRHARARELCSCRHGKKGQEQLLGGNEPWPDYAWPAGLHSDSLQVAQSSPRSVAELRWMNAETWHILDKLGLLNAFTAAVLGVCALCWQQGAARVAFVRRNQDLSLHCAERVPNCSKTEAPHDTQLSLLTVLVAPLQKHTLKGVRNLQGSREREDWVNVREAALEIPRSDEERKEVQKFP